MSPRKDDAVKLLKYSPLVLIVLAVALLAGRSPEKMTGEHRLTNEQLEATLQALGEKRDRLEARQLAPMDQPREAAEFFLQQRLAPGQTELPLEKMRRELDGIRAREAALAGEGRGRGPGGISSWQSIGPGNIGGRTRSIVIDPVTPDTMYSGGVAGGIWKSTDAGASWDPADDLMLNLNVCALVIDPSNTSVLYAGTGEGVFSGNASRGLGIFKSTDAGASWNQLPGTVSGVPEGAFRYVNELVISPNDTNRIYAATRTGVWRSTDAGENWSLLLGNPRHLSGPFNSNGCSVGCSDLAVRSDRNPDTLFAAFGIYESDGLYLSEDGGDSWVGYTTGPTQGRMEIAIAPSNNDVIYLTMADNGTGIGLGRMISVFRADDGYTFNAVLDQEHPISPWLFSYLAIATGCYEHPTIYSQGWHDNVIAVDPINPMIVWVGGIDLFRSDDGGQTFGLASYWFYFLWDPQPTTYVHVDQHEIVFHPGYNGLSNQTMYVGNDGGVWRTATARAATTQEECPIGPDPGPPPEIVWENMNNGYGVTQFYHGDAALLADRFVGGAQDNGSSQVESAATPEDWEYVYGGDGGYVAIDPRDDRHYFVEIQGFPTIAETNNGGISFSPAVTGITDTDGLFITPLAMDQANPDVMWTGGSRPWRTSNGAGLWERVGPDFSGATKLSAIAISPVDSNVVWFGFINGYMARTTNGLAEKPDFEVFANGLPGGWISSVAADPVSTETAYCTISSYGVPHVMKTTDGGDSWVSIDGISVTGVPDIPAHWIAVRPANPQQLYVGTELGLFASNDGGGTWFPANSGLAHTIVESLDWKDPDTLVAFTHGRGAFITHLDTMATVDADLACQPSIGTLPFVTQMWVTLDNLYAGQTRRVAARLDVQLAGGASFPGWRAGYTNLGPGGSYSTSWNQSLPALGTLVGDNVFALAAEDVTPAPYNQPPYPASGDTGTASCTVTGQSP